MRREVKATWGNKKGDGILSPFAISAAGFTPNFVRIRKGEKDKRDRYYSGPRPE
jgi:hypothetical protein